MLASALTVKGAPAPDADPFSPDKMHLHHRLLEIGHPTAASCRRSTCGRHRRLMGAASNHRSVRAAADAVMLVGDRGRARRLTVS
jgi:hypothetical protein